LITVRHIKNSGERWLLGDGAEERHPVEKPKNIFTGTPVFIFS